MNLAAVVVHYGSSEFTQAVLAKLENSRAIHRIIVVLHDKFEGNKDYSRTIFIQSENLGYAAGINRAVRYLLENCPEVSHVLAMNVDIEISDFEIQSIIAEHQAS